MTFLLILTNSSVSPFLFTLGNFSISGGVFQALAEISKTLNLQIYPFLRSSRSDAQSTIHPGKINDLKLMTNKRL